MTTIDATSRLGNVNETPAPSRDGANGISPLVEFASDEKTSAFFTPAPFTLEEKYEGGATDPYRRTTGCLVDSATIAFRNDGQPGLRLFATVRGDPSVTYFDVTDDRQSPGASPCGGDFCLSCDADSETNRCGASHLIGQNPQTNQRGLVLATEPSEADASSDHTAAKTP